jgi:hypothetical protein
MLDDSTSQGGIAIDDEGVLRNRPVTKKLGHQVTGSGLKCINKSNASLARDLRLL